MASVLKSLSLIADPTRVRLLLLLKQEELSVAELQEVLSLPQSNISAQLAKLKTAGLVSDRRSGKNRLYQLDRPGTKDQPTHEHFLALLEAAGAELREVARDADALQIVLRKRAQTAKAYFDALAGKFGRHYIPGRSWKGLGETLLKLMPPLVIADLGAGEILLTSMDRDGTKTGFDLALTRAVSDAVSVPVIASGGVGGLQHLSEGIRIGGADAVLAASIFHYGEFTVGQAKALLARDGIPVRL